MFEILVLLVTVWLGFKVVGLLFKTAWGLAKIIESLLFVLAIPNTVFIADICRWNPDLDSCAYDRDRARAFKKCAVMKYIFLRGIYQMEIRRYQETDLSTLTDLFYHTVHGINAKDYTKEQLDAWATGQVDKEGWNRSLLEHYSIVALENGIIVGFGDIDRAGYLDRLYVHKDYQRRGIATAICDEIEKRAKTFVLTHASITAKSFFEKRGYCVLKEQQVERRGVYLANYVMRKAV